MTEETPERLAQRDRLVTVICDALWDCGVVMQDSTPTAEFILARLIAADARVGPDEGLRAALEIIAAVEAACPVCGGAGWTTEADPSDETGQTPMQVQCWDAEHVVILNAGLPAIEGSAE